MPALATTPVAAHRAQAASSSGEDPCRLPRVHQVTLWSPSTLASESSSMSRLEAMALTMTPLRISP